MNKQTAIQLIIIVILTTLLIGIVTLIIKEKNRQGKMTQDVKGAMTQNLQPQTFSYTEALNNKLLKEVNILVEFPKGKPVKTAEISNVEALRKQNPLFNRVYDGDIVVMYPDKTIFYDPTTKTIRDVTSESLLPKEEK